MVLHRSGNHTIRKHHSAQDFSGVSKSLLYKYYRLTVCNKQGCGKVVMARINQSIPLATGCE